MGCAICMIQNMPYISPSIYVNTNYKYECIAQSFRIYDPRGDSTPKSETTIQIYNKKA
jgi:hypothetical protein